VWRDGACDVRAVAEWHVLGITERVCIARTAALGLAPDSGAATAEVALADRSIMMNSGGIVCEAKHSKKVN
jgi:hypothetical protein